MSYGSCSVHHAAEVTPDKSNNNSTAVQNDSRRKLVKVALNRHPTEGLGFNIHGGWDQPYIGTDTGIFVTKIRRGGQAEKNGALDVGDRIVKLNGQFLDNLSHQTVVSMFRRAGDKIKLMVEKNAYQKVLVAEKSEKGDESIYRHSSTILKHAGIAASVMLALTLFHHRENVINFTHRLVSRLMSS